MTTTFSNINTDYSYPIFAYSFVYYIYIRTILVIGQEALFVVLSKGEVNGEVYINDLLLIAAVVHCIDIHIYADHCRVSENRKVFTITPWSA